MLIAFIVRDFFLDFLPRGRRCCGHFSRWRRKSSNRRWTSRRLVFLSQKAEGEEQERNTEDVKKKKD